MRAADAGNPQCDIHKRMTGEVVPAKYDEPTDFGPWAYTCEECHIKHGLGNDNLGTEFTCDD